MPLVALKFKPGVNKEGTDYASEGGWYASDMVRFRSGAPQKIGGWGKYTLGAFLGICNALFNWITLSSQNILALGTNWKYYLEYGSVLNDITPIRRTVTLANNPFTTINGNTTVTVTDAGHGAVTGDFVTFSGATGFNGLAAGDLNKEFQLTWVSSSTYTITVGATPNASSSGGGAAVVAAYQINVGQNVATFGDGWGAGAWGRSGWGSGVTTTNTISQLRIWTQSNFGEDLVFNARNGPIYYWDASGGFVRAVDLSTISGANQTPTVACGVLFTDARYLVAFGANPIGSSTQDPMFIRWASQESLTDWSPTATNTAGGQRLTSGSYIVGHLRMKQEVLVWTDSDLYSMQFVGSPFIHSFEFLGRGISVAGPNAMAAAGDAAYWMGFDKFYFYNGRVQTLRCDLLRYVFNDINLYQMWQVFCGVNEQFNEIIWFYPSANSQSINRCVVYNYLEDIWYPGTLARTAWLDTHLRPFPLAASADGYFYNHDYGTDDGSTNPPQAINAYIESANMDIDNGDHLMFVKRMIPDVGFTGSASASPQATITLKVRDYPGQAYNHTYTNTVTSTSTGNPETFSRYFNVRMRGRQVLYRIESNTTGVMWQNGLTRLEAQPDGRRG